MSEQDTQDPEVVIRNADGTEEKLRFSELAHRMRMGIQAVEMTVSCGETFQKRQFEPKNYHSSMKFDLTQLWKLVASVEDPAMQVQARNAVAQVVRAQHVASDSFQRETLRYIAQLDGLKVAASDVQDRREAMGGQKYPPRADMKG